MQPKLILRFLTTKTNFSYSKWNQSINVSVLLNHVSSITSLAIYTFCLYITIVENFKVILFFVFKKFFI